MAVNFTEEQINNIIRLRTVENWGISRIAKQFGVGYKPVKRIIDTNGIPITPVHFVQFTESEKVDILAAYDSGIGAGGIHSHLGLNCSATPVVTYLRKTRGQLRSKSEQQFFRMANASPEEIARLTKKAHDATRGSKKSMSTLYRRAKTMEGKISNRSRYEPLVLDVLEKNFGHVFPGKAVDRYNLDFAVRGSVAVEVFGGGWAISDKGRLNRYIERTKQIAKSGFNTVFIMLTHVDVDGINWDELIRTVDLASRDPASERQYWVVWGDLKGASGLSRDIDHSAFIPPFINVRDRTTGRYKSVAR
jgi:hypothetical protein